MAKEKTEYVSQREFARRVGVAHTWIHKRVKEGYIPYFKDKGGIPWHEGIVAYEAAKDGRRENQRAMYEAQRKERRASNETKQIMEDARASVGADAVGMSVSDSIADTIAVNEKLNYARMRKLTYEAKIKELEYKEAEGELVRKEEVRRDGARIGILIQQSLISLGGRVASRCEGATSAEIEDIIRSEVNEIMKELRHSAYAELPK